MKKFLTIAMIVVIMVIGLGCVAQSSGENREPDGLVFVGDINGNKVYEFKDAQGRAFMLADGVESVSIIQIK